jgi:3',5'-cyclic-nucleotide phosphodiesterase
MANHYRPTHHFPITSKSANTLPSSLYSTLYFNPYHLTSFELTKIPYLIFESALTKLNIPFNPHLLNELIHVIYQGYLTNHYHNFYHAIDVLQSIYMFLKYLGLGEEKAPLLHIFTPKLVIALLVAGLGHDIGHPGVNNQFLIQSSFPIASLHPPTLATAPILEEFHTQLLAHLITNGHLHLAFPTLFESADELNQLLRPIILATDMGAHFSYIERMSSLSHFPLHQSQGMTLACGLIKCADLINVARPLPISKTWCLKLDRELAHQSHLQSLLSPNPTVTPTPPSTKITAALVTNQKSFMGAIAVPLFDLTTKLLPWLSPVNDQLKDNLVSWGNWENEA